MYKKSSMKVKVEVQDNKREKETRKLFALKKDEKESRQGIDAILKINGKTLEFELKSTSRKSVTTVRDFGPDHIKKWKGKHWIIGVYDSNGKPRFFKYGSPDDMKKWIEEKAKYVKPDYDISKIISRKLSFSLQDLYSVLGKKKKYSLDDAQLLQKKQYTKAGYRKMMDLTEGYSPKKMLKIMKHRSEYLLGRGSTLNNPHIPESVYENWSTIKKDHANILRKLVKSKMQ